MPKQLLTIAIRPNGNQSRLTFAISKHEYNKLLSKIPKTYKVEVLKERALCTSNEVIDRLAEHAVGEYSKAIGAR